MGEATEQDRQLDSFRQEVKRETGPPAAWPVCCPSNDSLASVMKHGCAPCFFTLKITLSMAT